MPIITLVEGVSELQEDKIVLIWKNPRTETMHLSMFEDDKTFCGLGTFLLEVTNEPYLKAERHTHCIKCLDQLIILTHD